MCKPEIGCKGPRVAIDPESPVWQLRDGSLNYTLCTILSEPTAPYGGSHGRPRPQETYLYDWFGKAQHPERRRLPSVRPQVHPWRDGRPGLRRLGGRPEVDPRKRGGLGFPQRLLFRSCMLFFPQRLIADRYLWSANLKYILSGSEFDLKARNPSQKTDKPELVILTTKGSISLFRKPGIEAIYPRDNRTNRLQFEFDTNRPSGIWVCYADLIWNQRGFYSPQLAAIKLKWTFSWHTPPLPEGWFILG